jgi:putative polyketide hydroxylase
MFRRGARAQQSPCTTVMCPQDVVERILRARIAITGSIRLRHGVEVRGVDVRDEEVLVHTADDNALLARYVVGADGASSPLRRACGHLRGWARTPVRRQDPPSPTRWCCLRRT